MLYERTNYTADISYLSNVFISEYDISKCNINVLYTNGAIDKETYDFLYGAERMVRQVYVGKLIKEDSHIGDILKAGIVEAKRMLFEANDIKDMDVLSIKNDAVFIINRKLPVTKFGLIEFVPKNIYTGFYKFPGMEIYYYYSNMTKEEHIDIKGISDNKLALHDGYFLQLLKDLFYSIQVNGPDTTMLMLKDAYMEYISLKLPIQYYRNFNADSIYLFKVRTAFGTRYTAESVEESAKPMLDITINATILLYIQRILVSMYFNKHK